MIHNTETVWFSTILYTLLLGCIWGLWSENLLFVVSSKTLEVKIPKLSTSKNLPKNVVRDAGKEHS